MVELNTDQIHAVKLNPKFQYLSVLPVRKGILVFSAMTVNLVIVFSNYVFSVNIDSLFRIIHYMLRRKLHAIIRPLTDLNCPYLSKVNFRIAITLSTAGSDSISCQPYRLTDICT
jgi:hypothetical protein